MVCIQLQIVAFDAGDANVNALWAPERTITLGDVLERDRNQSNLQGASFRDTLNHLLRAALLNANVEAKPRTLKMEPTPMCQIEGLL